MWDGKHFECKIGRGCGIELLYNFLGRKFERHGTSRTSGRNSANNVLERRKFTMC